MKYCLFVREDLALLKEDFFNSTELNGMKSDTYMYRDLKKYLKEKGIDLNTQLINKPEDCEVVICLNETGFFVNYKRSQTNKLLTLILTEPPVYNFTDWAIERHTYFDKVFTYDSDVVKRDPLKYVHVNFPIDLNYSIINEPISEADFNNKKLSSLVAGAITITHSADSLRSLLFERYKIIKWYNKNHPDDLDFYSRLSPLNKFEHFKGASFINKISVKLTRSIAKILFGKNIAKVYKGAIASLDKNKTLASYKFNFCLENSHGIKGLISEKIFDCFIGRTIPVYYGAPDIEHYIPKKCFILYTDFSSLKDLHSHLLKMDYKTYIQYLESASEFLKTSEKIFSTKTFIDKIYNVIKL
ncbi:MAG: hypothetical protein JNJ40_04915 [Bacteroidia bacterium]|nr:hypothetical protein [Bacteroidia bacterium]